VNLDRINSIAQACNKDKFYNSNGFSMANRFDSKEKLETGQFDVEADKPIKLSREFELFKEKTLESEKENIL
jgi:hypothetical protein